MIPESEISTPPAAPVQDTVQDDREAEFREKVINKILLRNFELPLLPHIAVKVIKLTGEPNVSMQDLAKVILTDQAIATQILKIANSPVYSGAVEVKSISQALMRLGIAEVKNLMLAISLKAKVFRSGTYGHVAKDLWEHSVAAAFAARTIAVGLNLDKEEAFLCGLMHDLGKMVLLSILETTQKELRDFRPTQETMMAILNQYNTDVGDLVSGKWNLPSSVQNSIKYHMKLEDLDTRDLLPPLTALADIFARMIIPGPDQLTEVSFESLPVVNRLQMSSMTCGIDYEKFAQTFDKAKGVFL
jgi:HD-like signal output (HDOD) protein